MASGLEPVTAQPAQSLEDYESAVEQLFIESATLHRGLQDHLFLSADVAQSFSAYMDGFRKQIAHLRAQLQKLVYGE